MAEQTEDQVKEVSYLDMSDEEILNVDPATVNTEPVIQEPEPQVSNDEGVAEDGNEETDEGQTTTEEGSEGLLNEGKDPAADQGEGNLESNPDP